MAKFKIEEEVVQIITKPIQGKVLQRGIDGDDDIFLVGWIDADGELHERWFREDEIQAVPASTPEA